MDQLTERSVLQIRMMFSEPDVVAALIDKESMTAYSRVDVDPVKCEIVFGKTRFNWWNHLCGDIKRISFKDFVATIIAVLSAHAEAEKATSYETIRDGLLGDCFDRLHRLGVTNEIVDRIFAVGYMGVKTTWSCLTLGGTGVSDKHDDVHVHVKGDEYYREFKLAGAGDAEIAIKFSPTDATIIRR